jgi:acyl-coenzyme A thioesterase PaaI-like protein
MRKRIFAIDESIANVSLRATSAPRFRYSMSESWKIKLLRWRFNRYPAYRQSGARVVRISEDFREITVRLPLNRQTRNLHGSLYGGAMYAAVDPLHAVIVANALGPDFHVWMKTARIDFRRPGRADLFTTARVTAHELAEIRTALTHTAKLDRDFTLHLATAAGEVAAHFTLTVHIKRRARHEPAMQDLVFAR